MSQQPIIALRKPQPGMTIAQAIANYKAKAGKESNCLKDVVGEVINKGAIFKLPNDSYADALDYTETMFFHTHKSINIVTGCGCGGFYATLLSHLTGALKRVKAAKGAARMIVIAKEYPEWLVALSYEFAGNFTLAQLPTKERLQHFIVCDSKIVRVEEPHTDLTPESPADAIKAEVAFNEPTVGRDLEVRFEALWQKAEVLKLDPANKPSAPSWLIQKMDALHQLPPPTSQQMRAQWAASMEFSRKSESKQPAS